MRTLHDSLAALREFDLLLEGLLEPTGDLLALRDQFLLQAQSDPKLRWPEFRYEGLDFDPSILEQKLRELKAPTVAEKHETELWEWFLQDAHCKCQLVMAAANYRKESVNLPRVLGIKCQTLTSGMWLNQFKYYMELLYGKLDVALFHQACRAQLDFIESRELRADDRLAWLDTAAELTLKLPSYVPEIYQPQPETVRRFGELVRERLAPYLAQVPEKRAHFTSSEVVDLLNEILVQECETEFRASLAPPGRLIIRVDQSQRLIWIPRAREAGGFTREEVISLVLGHEFGTHVLRGISCEHGHLPQLSCGLPEGDEFEEGLALCVEQALSGRYQTRGWWRALSQYVNIGFAMLKQFDFREIMELRQKLNFLAGCCPGESQLEREVRQRQSYQRAFSEAQRCFWGAQELVSTRNLCYLRGNIRAWQYIERNLEDPDRLWQTLFECGKTDPENLRHRLLLKYEM